MFEWIFPSEICSQLAKDSLLHRRVYGIDIFAFPVTLLYNCWTALHNRQKSYIEANTVETYGR